MYKPLGLTILIFLTMGTAVHAASTAGLVSKANSLYLAGKYDEALSAYEEASEKAPESPRLYFNKGAAYYRKENFEKAKEAFEKAALKTKDVKLEAMARFNLGNCSFSQAQLQKNSDLNKTLEACQTAIRHYQEALTLDPGMKEAAENIEVVRLVMKNIMDEINKQKEAAEKKQAAADKLKKLIQQQQELLDRNHHLTEEKTRQGDSPDIERKISELANDQNVAGKKTRDLAAALTPPVEKTTAVKETSKNDPAKHHLETSADEQADAAAKLSDMQTSAAQENQKTALDELNKALASLSGDTGQQGKRNLQKAADADKDKGQHNDQKNAQKDQGQEQKKEAQERQNGPGKQDGAEKEMQQQPLMTQGDARSILDEEKENLQQRRASASGGYSDVDRDW